MKVLVIGGRGSIGSRYTAILRHLGHEPMIYDIEEAYKQEFLGGFEKAIVASPTNTHFQFANALDCPTLIEKPLSKNLLECERLLGRKTHYVVNNWQYTIKDLDTDHRKYKINYDYYHTGRDGVAWDVCQLLYLGQCTINTESPVFKVMVNKTKVTLEKVQISYVRMIHDFVEGKTENLWGMQDGYFMSRAVYDYIGKQTRTDVEDVPYETAHRNPAEIQ